MVGRRLTKLIQIYEKVAMVPLLALLVGRKHAQMTSFSSKKMALGNIE